MELSDGDNYRKDRIERLLHELRYEITRGMIEGEIFETLTFKFAVPISKEITGGVVKCEFHTRPVHRIYAEHSDLRPRLVAISPSDGE